VTVLTFRAIAADRAKVAHTLLLADDSVTIQRVIELTFADEDVRVVAVSDGEAAIAALGRTPPDIVLADVGMPGRSGYEVAEHIKGTPHLAHIPVVLLTGAFEPIDQARANAAGCDGVLAKPFEPQLVIGRVKELLGRPRQAEPASASEAPAVGQTGGFSSGQAAAAQAPASDDYFNRLDEAFANLTSAPVPPVRPAEPIRAVEPPAPAHEATDWFSTRAPEAPPPLSLPAVSAAPPAHTTPAAAAAQQPAAGLPTLAEAFSSLLRAEGEAPAGTAPVWPAAAAMEPLNTDDLVEQITRRVLEEMSDRVVRETVSDIVSNVAERLVLQEIARIKANIK
jgi:CheY-like chemotaxis protein